MHGNVGWRDYAGLQGFGQATAEEVGDLRKALSAGQDVNSPGVSAGEGFPLRVESLENTLKSVTYKMDDVRLWSALTKLPAFNTVFPMISNTYADFVQVGFEVRMAAC